MRTIHFLLIPLFFLLSCGDAFTGELEVGDSNGRYALIDECFPEYDNANEYRDPYENDTRQCLYCGDGLCQQQENASNCAIDCSYCGDNQCDQTESSRNCPSDCGARCGDGTCNGAETRSSCNSDCGPKLKPVLLERVRACRNKFPFPCNSRVTNDDYRHWDQHGVSKNRQKKTFIARASDPAKSKVEHLVFIAAGQAGIFSKGWANALTGQPFAFDRGFKGKEASRTVSLASGSFAKKLIESSYGDYETRELSNTFMGLAFDPRFHQEYSQGAKNEIENAYYAWLRDQFYSSKIKSIFLAGHSRGGCLAFRLGKRFARDFPSVPVIVQGYDPVCKAGQGEFGTHDNTNRQIKNPIAPNTSYYTYSTDMKNQFTHRNNLRVYNIVSGDRVVGDGDLFIKARAMSHRTLPTTVLGYGFVSEGDWYFQQWVTDDHMAIDRRWHEGLKHFKTSCDDLGC